MKKVIISIVILLCLLCTVGCNLSETEQPIDDTSFVSTDTQESEAASLYDEESDSSENAQTETSTDSIERDYKLIVGGNEITSEHPIKMYVDERRYAEVPFVAVMQELGAEFEWQSESVAKMSFREMSFVLDVTKCNLVTEGQEINLINPPPGGTRYYTSLKKELIIDNRTAKGFFDQVGITLEMDYDNRVVNIDRSPNPPPKIEYIC